MFGPACTAAAAASPDPTVTVTSKHVLQCANVASVTEFDSPLKLGPMDTQVAAFIPVAVVFVYEKPADLPTSLLPIPRLQTALAKLLDYYPHLTGRLRLHPSGSRDIANLGTGAELVVAQCSARLRALHTSSSGRITLPALPGAGNALLPPFDTALAAVCAGPLLTVQHTRFACGSAALGVRLLHTVTDSDGFFQLVRDLAEVYRGIDDGRGLSHPPHIRCHLSAMTPAERAAALAFKPAMFGLAPSADSTPPPASSPPPPPPTTTTPTTGRVLRFSAASIARLKTLATPPDGNAWASTFDALSAHLWQRSYCARLRLLASRGESTSDLSTHSSLPPPAFLTSVNMRGATGLGLPARYFPNGIVTPFTSVEHEGLASGPLSTVAAAIHAMTRSVSPAEAEATMRWLAAQPDAGRVRLGFEGGFMVSSWAKFDVYAGCAFEVGPKLVAPPFTGVSLVDGLGYLLSTGEEGGEGKGGVDVYLALGEEVWEELRKDGEFWGERE